MTQSETDAAAVRAFPELRHLITLRDGGWRFLPAPHVGGVPVRIDGFREYPGHWDAIRVESPVDVLGIRMTRENPPGLVWERTGSLGEVVTELALLPPPDHRLAPYLVTGTAPLLVPGHLEPAR
ncbi:hypothetical protein GCM10012275_48740 [Longimycelium tulufanense]|uniref:Uncharacterized protein n=1 Tax=Longimycelium tulufanense TaxID=907463 RepID=A0A8J3FVX9_9PSEU|nr:hypothetical protein [Longimycelium tulufanense]GGM72421.1 hypothetical protein GCM10012275_48740 [Longimycelium tulufanense]